MARPFIRKGSLTFFVSVIALAATLRLACGDGNLPLIRKGVPDTGIDVIACQELICKDKPNKSKHPNPYNCRKYYECRGARKLEKECPEGEVFSNGQCDPSASCKFACPTDEVDICGVKIHCLTFAVRRLVHPSDCHLYFMCDVNGKLSLEMCPPGERFDSRVRTCKTTSEASCVLSCGDPIPISPPITPADKTTKQGKNPTTPAVIPATCNGPIECTTATVGRRYPVPGKCTDYYVCSTDRLVTMTCPLGTMFDKVKLRCLSTAFRVDCQESCKDPMIKSTPQTKSTTSTTEMVTLADSDPETTQNSPTTTPTPQQVEETTTTTLADNLTDENKKDEPMTQPKQVTPTPSPTTKITTTTTPTTTATTPTTTHSTTKSTTTSAVKDKSSTTKPLGITTLSSSSRTSSTTTRVTTTSNTAPSSTVSSTPLQPPSSSSRPPVSLSSSSSTSSSSASIKPPINPTTHSSVQSPNPTNPQTSSIKNTPLTNSKSDPGISVKPTKPASTSIPTTEETFTHEIKNNASDRIIKDHTATFSCRFTTSPTVLSREFNITWATMQPKIVWTLDGQIIRNGSRAYILTKTDLIKQHITSIVTIRRMKPQNKLIRCDVYSRDSLISTTSRPFTVIERPRVYISPRSAIAAPGQQVIIKCSVDRLQSISLGDKIRIEWFKNNYYLSGSDVEFKNEHEYGVSSITIKVKENTEILCIGSNDAGSSNIERMMINVMVNTTTVLYCEQETVDDIRWPRTIPGGVKYQPCQSRTNTGKVLGDASRTCLLDEEKKAAEWGAPDYSDCTSEEMLRVSEQISSIGESFGAINDTAMVQTMNQMEHISNKTEPILTGDLILIVDAFQKITDIREGQEKPPSTEEYQSVINTESNLFDQKNKETWKNIEQVGMQSKAVNMLKTVDIYTGLIGRHIPPGKQLTVHSPNIYIMMQAIPMSEMKDVRFPDYENNKIPKWSDNVDDVVLLSEETMQSFKHDVKGDSINIGGSYYRTLGEVMPTANNTELSSRILSLSILNLKKPPKLDPPINLQFAYEKKKDENMVYNCSFWDYSMPDKGGWSQRGCTTIIKSDSKITCHCDHLTNFAILVSPGPISDRHKYILSMISLIGCIISIVALLMTIIFYISMWKALKSHHAVVLLNLCVALVCGNLLFITGINRTENKLVCSIIAGLLHYFWLVAFFMMLVEGIQLLMYIIYVFHLRRKAHTAGLIFGGWFLPAVIVGVSMAITNLEGYGRDEACWLSIKGGLLWAFVGPVLIVILINFIILLVVLKRATSASIPSGKKKNKLRSVVWNIFVITPLLGITWVLGVFSVNEDTIFFQYIFAIANSLQGLFIFIFHALCNKKKGRYALKETTSSKSRKLTPTGQTTSEQNSSHKSKSKVHINGSLKDRDEIQTINGIPKLDLHSSPSYDMNGTCGRGDKIDICHQLGDGTEITLINSHSSVKSNIGRDGGPRPVLVLQPHQVGQVEGLSRSPPTPVVTGVVDKSEEKSSATHPVIPEKANIPERPLSVENFGDKKLETSSGPPPVPTKPKPIFSNARENKNAKVIVAVKPLNIPEIDTTNLMSSPDWPEVVQHLPDDVAETIISTSRPTSGHYTEGMLFPPSIDGLRSLSSTPSRLESELDSLASSFVSLNKNIEEGFSTKNEPNDGEVDPINVVTEVVPEVDPEVEENGGSLVSVANEASQSSASADKEDESQQDVGDSFDPPPEDYQEFVEDSVETSIQTDIPSVEPARKDEANIDHSNAVFSEHHPGMSVSFSTPSIPDQTTRAQNQVEDKMHESEPISDDVIERNEASPHSIPERAQVIRTSSYLPPMPLDMDDPDNYRTSGEFPPPPPPEEIWPSATGVESTVPSDDIPLVTNTPISAPVNYSHLSNSHDVTGTDPVRLRHVDVSDQLQNNDHPQVDNRISVVSTIPPSPTTTTTDVSWTSDLSKDTANASVI